MWQLIKRQTRMRAGLCAVVALLAITAAAASGQGRPAQPTTTPGAHGPGSSSAAKQAQAGAGTSAPSSATSATSGSDRVLMITVPQAGNWEARIVPSADAKEPNPLPVPFSDSKTTLTYDPAKEGRSPKLAVDDEATGNTAVVPIPESPAGSTEKPIDLHRADFEYVHTVHVDVTYAGKPVQVARVTLAATDKAVSYTQTKTIDTSARGAADFSDVPVGKAKLTILYGGNLSQAMDVVITTDHAPGPLSVPAAVANKVATLDTPAAAATATGAVPPQSPSAVAPAPAPAAAQPPTGQPQDGLSAITGLIGNLIAIAIVFGGGYLFWRWFQSGGFAATMKKAGVELNAPAPTSDAGTPWQPNAPSPPVISDPTVCQFCGQKKDAAGNCACAVGAPGSPVRAAAAGPAPATATQPRLVGTMGVYSGTIFPLSVNGSAVTLGREASNSIPLGNDNTVSRRHAAIRADQGGYTVSDEGSANGVFVNGVRISGAQLLRPGDEVQIGNTRFRFEV